MKSWSTLCLALVSLGLLGYLYFLGLDAPGTKEKEERQARVFSFDSEKVDQLELVSGEVSLLMKRTPAGLWEIEKPLSYPADLSNVRQVLSDFEFARRRDTLPRKAFADYNKALESMGLKTPKVTVRIREGKKNSTLAIGNETARTGQYYALMNDGRDESLIIVERSVEESALREVGWFRKREIFDFQTPLVTGVVLRKGEQEIDLSRAGDQWSVTRPLAGPADETQVISYLAELLSGKVAQFVADGTGDLVAFGLSAPLMVLEIKSGDRIDRLRIGQAVPGREEVYAQINARPNVVSLPRAYVEKLGNLLDRTQDRRVLVFQDPFEWSAWSIQTAKGQLALKQGTARGWLLGAEPGRAGDTQLINTFLNSLRDLRATQLLPKSEAELSKWGLTPAANRITLTRKSDAARKDAVPEEILFSSARKGKIYAASTRLPFIAELPETALALLPVVPSDWYDKRVSLIPNPELLVNISWQHPSGTVTLGRDEKGNWPLVSNGRALDQSRFTQIRAMLGGMAVASWVPLRESDFAKPRFSLVLGMKDGSSRIVDFILLGNPAEYRGRIRGEPEMFVVRGSEMQLLEEPPYEVKETQPPENPSTVPPAAPLPGKP